MFRYSSRSERSDYERDYRETPPRENRRRDSRDMDYPGSGQEYDYRKDKRNDRIKDRQHGEISRKKYEKRWFHEIFSFFQVQKRLLPWCERKKMIHSDFNNYLEQLFESVVSIFALIQYDYCRRFYDERKKTIFPPPQKSPKWA